MKGLNTVTACSIVVISCLVFAPSCGESAEDKMPDNTTEEFMIDGIWSGIFRSNLFPNGNAYTFDLAQTGNNKYGGKVYATSGTVSCCGGPDDGSVSLTIVNDSIDFKIISGVMDCPGIFEGVGIFEVQEKMVLTFSGNDCDGDHEDGNLTLFKR
ncbi:MAG: hypothetical protein RJQ09_19005 [Cyclobacteriaceae bacterium]